MSEEKKTNKLLKIAEFFIPIILGLSVYGLIGMILEENMRFKYWSLISAYFFPPLGKESVIPTGVGLGIEPLLMALSIAFVDIVVALFLLWNYDLAKKIPLIGKFIEKIENIGKNSSNKYGWIKPLRFIGIILFVMVPFQGSGGLVGSIIGRLIGMKPVNTFLAISIGAILGCTLIAYFADAILSVFVTNFLQGLLILIILIVIGIMIYIYKKNHKK
jgi:uncharacterized membrane protein